MMSHGVSHAAAERHRADVDCLLRQAIAEKRLIAFELKGKQRVAEPHDYGVKNGEPLLLAYQVGGETSPGGKLPQWRWVRLAEAKHFRLLERRFAGGRPTKTSRHSNWDVVFARVSGRQT
jgi:hypothetical protein